MIFSIHHTKLFGLMGGLGLAFAATHAQAVALNGRLYVDGMVRSEGFYVDGSYFAMGADNPNGNYGNLQPAAGGGYIQLGSFQNYVTNPDVPHPQGWQGDTNGDGILDGAAGAGYSTTLTSMANIFAPFSFFGTPTHVGTLPVSYQNGSANVAPSADVDLGNCVGSVCVLSVDLSSWEVFWNGSSFQQGPRPVNTGPFTMATGTLDISTGHYELSWASQIYQGPFNGVTGYWHIEGTHAVPVPAAVWLFGSGLLGLISAARRVGR